MDIANRRGFAVVPIEGFNPDRIRSLLEGMKITLGSDISAAAVLDRDYRPQEEVAAILTSCGQFCRFAHIHSRKEIENFLLVPPAINRAVAARLDDRNRRRDKVDNSSVDTLELLRDYANRKRIDVLSQITVTHKEVLRKFGSRDHEATLMKSSMASAEHEWETDEGWLSLIPGKDALSWLNQQLQIGFSVSVTPTAIIDAMRADEVPGEMKGLLEKLHSFSLSPN